MCDPFFEDCEPEQPQESQNEMMEPEKDGDMKDMEAMLSPL